MKLVSQYLVLHFFSSAIFLVGIFLTPAADAAVVRFGEKLCAQEGYSCYTVIKGDTWDKLFADADQRDLVRRINRLNIRLRVGMILAVPLDLEKTTRAQQSPFAPHDPAITEKTVVYDESLLAWGAYGADGNLVEWGPASGGRGWCPDIKAYCTTPVGEYNIYTKGGADCKSRTFPIPDGGAPMPYCMFFHGGYAIHGSSELPGYNASHGCIRVYSVDAKWLSQNFVERPTHGLPGTRVVVRSSPPLIPVDKGEKKRNGGSKII